jgi:drug/metabolite transporter (DMT)-like permease
MSSIDTQTPQPVGPYAAAPRNGYGVAAMVLGIVGVVAAFNGFFIFTLPLALSAGVLATVFGVLGRRRVQRAEADNGGQALAGIILGPIAILLVVALLTGLAAFGWDRGSHGWADRDWGNRSWGPWEQFQDDGEPGPETQ